MNHDELLNLRNRLVQVAARRDAMPLRSEARSVADAEVESLTRQVWGRERRAKLRDR